MKEKLLLEEIDRISSIMGVKSKSKNLLSEQTWRDDAGKIVWRSAEEASGVLEKEAKEKLERTLEQLTKGVGTAEVKTIETIAKDLSITPEARISKIENFIKNNPVVQKDIETWVNRQLGYTEKNLSIWDPVVTKNIDSFDETMNRLLNLGIPENLAKKQFREICISMNCPKGLIDRYLETLSIKSEAGVSKVESSLKPKVEIIVPSTKNTNIQTDQTLDLNSMEFTNEEDLINFVKEKYPMTEEESQQFIMDYSRSTGKNPTREFNAMGWSFAGGDYIKVATFLKYNIQPPTAKYLYHGTASERLPSIIEKGLDNSVSPKPLNLGSMPTNLGEGITTATGDLKKATTYSKTSAQATNSQPVIVRFENEKKYPITYFNKHDAIPPDKLEYSFDNGLTWVKNPQIGKFTNAEDILKNIDSENYYYVTHETDQIGAKNIDNTGFYFGAGLNGTALWGNAESIANRISEINAGRGHRGSSNMVIMRFPKSLFETPPRHLDDISFRIMDLNMENGITGTGISTIPKEYIWKIYQK
jgi:hypothetical protein